MNQFYVDKRRCTNGRERPFSLPLILFLIILLLLPACGGDVETKDETVVKPETVEIAEPTQENEPPAPTPTPIPEPTLTAAEHQERGQEYAESENYDDAIVELQAVLDQEPDNADALAMLGGVYLNQGKLDDAGAALDKAISVEAEHPLANSNLCSTLALQAAKNALDTCKQAVLFSPEDADAQTGLGVAYARQGEFDEAIAAYQEAIQLEPEHEWAHNNLGYTYINMEQYDQAIAPLNEAVRVAPDNAKAHYNLGLAYANLEQYEEAIPVFEETLSIDPSMVLTYIDLAIIYTRLERLDDAIASFETYLELAPNADNREAVEEEIARLSAIVMGEEPMASADSVDYTNPESVLQAVFSAAATGDFTNLAGLCDPLGENDGDTALICEVTADHEMAGEFEAYFRNGRIDGDLLIDGDYAELPFLFGPDGDEPETMNFILRDGKWYLFDF